MPESIVAYSAVWGVEFFEASDPREDRGRNLNAKDLEEIACGLPSRYMMCELTESMSPLLKATTKTLANNQGTERSTR